MNYTTEDYKKLITVLNSILMQITIIHILSDLLRQLYYYDYLTRCSFKFNCYKHIDLGICCQF